MKASCSFSGRSRKIRFGLILTVLIFCLTSCTPVSNFVKKPFWLLGVSYISDHETNLKPRTILVNSGIRYALQGQVSWRLYQAGDSVGMGMSGQRKYKKSTFELFRGEQSIKKWKFKGLVHGNTFPSQGGQGATIIFLDRHVTQIFAVKQNRVDEIVNFETALTDPDPVISRYARREIALRFLPPRKNSSQSNRSESLVYSDNDSVVQKYKNSLGSLAKQSVLELHNDIYASESRFYDPDLGARIIALLPAMGLLSAEDVQGIILNPSYDNCRSIGGMGGKLMVANNSSEVVRGSGMDFVEVIAASV